MISAGSASRRRTAAAALLIASFWALDSSSASAKSTDTEEAAGETSDEALVAVDLATQALAERAVQLTEDANFTEAIHAFEQLSDRNFKHADLSYNRALAYLQRAESTKVKNGDLGQVVAALREASLLGDTSSETEVALEQVRKEISRQRARKGEDPVIIRPALGRAFVALLPESFWAALALLGSISLCAGLLLHKAGAGTQRRLAAQVLGATGVVFLGAFGPITALSKSYSDNSQEAVIIQAEAPLLSESGRRLKAKALDLEASAIPEGASIYVIGRQGRLLHIEWGPTKAWVNGEQLRIVAPLSNNAATGT